MKRIKVYIAVLFSIILLFTPSYAIAKGENDFTAVLSVSDTSVPEGTVVTCTIKVTNTDNTYGADIAISYNGQNIDSYYLAAGASKSTTHDITIEQTTNVYYTVYASHGPDISKTKNTNTVTVSIETPATAEPTATYTPKPTYTPTAEPTEVITPAPDITPEITPNITPEVTPETTPYIESDDNLGWGDPINMDSPPKRVMDNLFKESLSDWLGINAPEKHEYINQFGMRRVLAAIAGLTVLSFIVFIIAAFRVIKK